MRGEEKSGYLDIKFPHKTRTKRTKPWCRRYVVLHKVSDLSAGKLLAKLDLYADRYQAKIPNTKLSTILLENVADIVPATSRTHSTVFEVRGVEPLFYFSAANETETHLWVSLLREIFCPPTGDDADSHEVWIRENDDSKRLSLVGSYHMTVSPSCIHIRNLAEDGCQWPLSSLKRFFVRPVTPEAKENDILILESGPAAPTGEARLMFVTPRAEQVLSAIRRNIHLALAQRKKRTDDDLSPAARVRAGSVTSSVRQYRHLLDSSIHEPGSPRCRTGSASTSVSDKTAPDQNLSPSSSKLQETGAVSHPEDRRIPDIPANKQSSAIPSKMPSSPTAGTCGISSTTSLPGEHMTSVSSQDSGILSQREKDDTEVIHRESSNSFDSAVCFSYDLRKASTQQNSALGTTTQESAKVCLENDQPPEALSQSTVHIYWDIDASPGDAQKEGTVILPRSRSAENISRKDHDYEELDRVKKKELWRFGYSGRPKEVPPALPARPKTLQLSHKAAGLDSPARIKSLGNFSSPMLQKKTRVAQLRTTGQAAEDVNNVIYQLHRFSKSQGYQSNCEENLEKSRDKRSSSATFSDSNTASCTQRRSQSVNSLNQEGICQHPVDTQTVQEFLKRDPFDLISDGNSDQLSPLSDDVFFTLSLERSTSGTDLSNNAQMMDCTRNKGKFCNGCNLNKNTSSARKNLSECCSTTAILADQPGIRHDGAYADMSGRKHKLSDARVLPSLIDVDTVCSLLTGND